MSEHHIYPVKPEIARHAHIDAETYQRLYQQSIQEPAQFWAEQAQSFLDWQQPWQQVMQCDFGQGEIHWFKGGKLNVSHNCLDRHLATRGDQVAIIWEGDNPTYDRTMTYRELHRQVCKFANVLISQGVKKGDRVCIYLPMILEAAVAILACARIGAIHSIVFGGFSADALRDRILDADCHFLICVDQSYRGGKIVPTKVNVDKAAAQCPNLDRKSVV